MIEDFLKIREEYCWSTCGIKGNEPFREVILKDIDDEHLKNIISWIKRKNDYELYFGADLEIIECEYNYRLKKYRREKLENLKNENRG
jgi:hypothetical protein